MPARETPCPSIYFISEIKAGLGYASVKDHSKTIASIFPAQAMRLIFALCVCR
jgi:hypothetical protein